MSNGAGASDSTFAEWSPDLSTGVLWDAIAESSERGELEAYLALLILRSGFDSTNTENHANWPAALRAISDSHQPIASVGRPQDVAILGIRLAFGHVLNASGDFATAARKELARQPMPPAACLRDDERILLGVAAGIGRAAPELRPQLSGILRDREQPAPLRLACLDRFAEALNAGATRLPSEVAARAFQLLTTAGESGRPTTDRDRIALYWLATRLMDAEWQPTDDQLSSIACVIDESGRLCRMALQRSQSFLDPLDAAMLIDAMSSAPATSLARNSGIDLLLRVIDGFFASAEVLSHRQRGRAPLLIADEYDVQDVFHALSVPLISDLVAEDPTAKIAGNFSRLDFTSKSLRLGVELKYVRNASHAKDVRGEILIDERTYQLHPYVDTVIAFIYDPNRHIGLTERGAFEADLSTSITVDGRSVAYLVRVR